MVVVEAPPAEPAAAVEIADAAVAVEQVRADAAVAQAAIQADAAVAIAEADANARVAIAEAETDEDDIAWLNDQFARLHARLDSQAETLATMMVQHQAMLERLPPATPTPSIPPPSAVPPMPPPPESLPASLPPSEADGQKESREPPKRRRYGRL